MKDEVIRWLVSGKQMEDGVALMQRAGAPSFALKLVSTHPERYRETIRTWLINKFAVTPQELSPGDHTGQQVSARDERPKQQLREEFPFLGHPDCPVELEALATRKIMRYHEYISLHQKLRDCTSLPDLALLCGKIINAYIENRTIYAELDYYKQHHALLGKHPIFRFFQRRKKILGMSIKNLMKRKVQLENNIWRAGNEIKKGNKPHLDVIRKERIEAYKAELAEVNRLLDEE